MRRSDDWVARVHMVWDGAIRLREAAFDPDPGVRAAVAGMPGLDADIQSRLARDPDPRVRVMLASNPSLGPEAMGLLAADREARVRRRLARREDLPAPVRERLRLDHDSQVQAQWGDPMVACMLAQTEED